MLAVTLTAGGCVSTGPNYALATPWGVAGVHAFAPESVPAEQSLYTDEAISKMLRDQSEESPTLVAKQ